MRREKIVIILLSLMLIILLINYFSSNALISSITTYNYIQSNKQSNEELYSEIIISLLDPYIENAISVYYGGPTPYDPWTIKIVNITKPYDKRLYNVVLNVTPYTGPHIQLGEDQIAFTINVNGNVLVNKFEHLKTYDYLEQRQKEIQERLKNIQ